jgi:hypothetical protein
MIQLKELDYDVQTVEFDDGVSHAFEGQRIEMGQ